MPLKNATLGMLAVLGGVVGGALSGGFFAAVRSAEAAPPPGNHPAQPNPVDPNAGPTPALTADLVPAVITVPAGGLIFQSSGGKVLAKLHTHAGGALLNIYNSAGTVVASLGADAQTKGGRVSLCTPSGGGCFIGLGLPAGGRLDLYHPQEAVPRATLGVRDTGHAGYLVLREPGPPGAENEQKKSEGLNGENMARPRFNDENTNKPK